MRFSRIGFGLCAAVSPLIAAPAQTATAAKETVTVKAIRTTVQVLPDRTVYSLDKNIQSSTGTLSDVLRNLPSVNVDIEGNVSLRGDTNVTILIDGKESPLLAGNRGDALQQIPANMVDRIEVITNPSAEFRAEGSGGIINIVLKAEKEQRASGVIRVNVGDEGRANVSASGNFKLGRVNLNGSYGERRDGRKFTASTLRSDGTTLSSSQDIAGKYVYAGRYAALTANRDFGSNDRAELGGSYMRFSGNSIAAEHNISVPDATDFSRDSSAYWQREGVQLQFSYTHKFSTKGEELNLDVSRYTSWGRNSFDATNVVTATGLADHRQLLRSTTRDTHTELKADYILPLADKGKFKAGYALQNDGLLSDDRGFWRDPTMADWADDSAFTNLFDLNRTIHAGYVSYERKFGRFEVMGGLRLEQDYLTTDLKTTGEVNDTATLGFYPSMHLSYSLTDTKQLNLSYSRRMNRPGASTLNPARYSGDAFNVWAGNPHLKPEQVDSFETSYRYTGAKFDAVVTGYYRATYKGITRVYRYLSDSVLLTTSDNLARRMASGAEANLNATLLPSLKLRATGSLAYNEFNPGAQGIGKKQSGMNWNIRGGIDWQVTPDDLVQFNTNYSSKLRFAQGYRNPSLSGDLGFKHSFDGGLATVVSVNNLFGSWNRGRVLDTPVLHQVDHHNSPGRVYFVGLVYTFGGAKDTQRITSDNEGAAGGAGNPVGQ